MEGWKTSLRTVSRVRAGSAGTVAAVRLDEPRRLRSLEERGAASAGSATPSAASAVIMASARSSNVALGAQTPSGAAQDKSPRTFPPSDAQPPSARAVESGRGAPRQRHGACNAAFLKTAPSEATPD